MLNKLFIILTFFCLTNCIAEDKPNLNVSVIPDSGTNDTKFFIQVTVSGTDVSSFKTPNFIDNEYFKIAINSNSIQEQLINGIATQQKTFVFSLTPKSHLKEGDYTSPNGTVEYNGKKYRLPSKTVHIESSKTFIGSALRAPDQEGFNFIQLLSNEKPYVGEQVSYRVEIIAPSNLLKAELEDFQVDGVWRERFGQDEKKQRQAYNVTIHSFSESWFPIQSGTINVPERKLIVALQQIRRVPSGFGLSGQLLGNLLPLISQFSTEEKSVTASPISFEVLPLPPPPTNVSGHIPVGKLKVTSSIDKKDGKVGEPISLTIQVSGDANLKPLEIGKSIEPIKENELRRYDEKPILKKVVNNPEVYFYKTFSITFIPLINGDIKIPQFKITWFDPKEKTYMTETTLDSIINVVGEPVLIPKRDTLDSENIDINAMRTKYSGQSYFLKPIYSFILFLISILAPLLAFSSKFLIQLLSKHHTSAKTRLNNILSNLNNATQLSSIEALQILKTASSILLKADAEPLTGKEIATRIELVKPSVSELTSILSELETIIYSKNTLLSENQKSRVSNLVKAIYEMV